MIADLLEDVTAPTVARMDGITAAAERLLSVGEPVRRVVNVAPDILSTAGERQLSPEGLCTRCETVTARPASCWWCGGPTYVKPPVSTIIKPAA